jgi:hypothetical protein
MKEKAKKHIKICQQKKGEPMILYTSLSYERNVQPHSE